MEIDIHDNPLRNRVIVALDTPDLQEVTHLTAELKGLIRVYKIGFELFSAHGWAAVEQVQKTGAEIFLDLKFHDIPNTVARASSVAAQHGVWMFNVHALGGLEMMKRARAACEEFTEPSKVRPRIIAVTILTSHSEDQLQTELRMPGSLQDRVRDLAQLAKKAGLDGVVCSPQEVTLLRKELGPDFLLVTPGIRTADSPADDQKRTLTPAEAFAAGASYIVVGRPITGSSSPRQAAQKILQSIA